MKFNLTTAMLQCERNERISTLDFESIGQFGSSHTLTSNRQWSELRYAAL